MLATRAYGNRYLPGRATRLAALARPLRARGIRLVRGPIVADERLFDSRRTGPGWPSYYSAYISPLSALADEPGLRGQRAEPPTSRAPRWRRPSACGRRSRASGSPQSGRLKVGTAPASGRILATATSPPLPVILRAMNLDSDNFIAETLAKDVGAYGAGRGTHRGPASPTPRPCCGSGAS